MTGEAIFPRVILSFFWSFSFLSADHNSSWKRLILPWSFFIILQSPPATVDHTQHRNKVGLLVGHIEKTNRFSQWPVTWDSRLWGQKRTKEEVKKNWQNSILVFSHDAARTSSFTHRQYVKCSDRDGEHGLERLVNGEKEAKQEEEDGKNAMNDRHNQTKPDRERRAKGN